MNRLNVGWTPLFTGVLHFEWRADYDWGYRGQDSVCTSWAPIHHADSGRSDVGGLHRDLIGWASVFPLWPQLEGVLLPHLLHDEALVIIQKIEWLVFCDVKYLPALQPRGKFCVIRWWRRPSRYSVCILPSSCTVSPSLVCPACLCVVNSQQLFPRVWVCPQS